ncbi:GAF domain-containing protein [Paenibacillus thermoaerophilus]|uniref:GAF domain-containing protein n=1 Tax=Paenibacillus thermoaerophilus TaxID=1215385 RepID=A0ABW2V088_9BACL|nr:GAF domain-containing protein [Paenibacillus thermoaerophilus]TMV18182.1 GAF domain-containing protein [Paenibacillus thermoaerophilus]
MEVLSLSEAIDRLRADIGCDFAAFAQPDPAHAAWRWTHASGSESGRYLRLTVRPGRGVAGIALLTGRLVASDRHRYAADLRKDDAPLWIPERLESAAAVPVRLGKQRTAVLLIGRRDPGPFAPGQLEGLQEAAERLALLFAAAQ